MSAGSRRSRSAASAPETGRPPLDSVLPHPSAADGVGSPGAGEPAARPDAPRRPSPVAAAVLTSPAGSRGPSDAMARGPEGAGPGRPEATRSADGAGAEVYTSPLFRLPSGRQEVRHRNASQPALLRCEVRAAVAVAAYGEVAGGVNLGAAGPLCVFVCTKAAGKHSECEWARLE